MKRYQNKICLVSGSTRGIGFAIARRFLQQGATVIILSRKQHNTKTAHSKLAKQFGEDRIVSFTSHFGKKQDRSYVLECIKSRFKRLDVLVANIAASTHVGSATDIDQKAYDKMWDINVKSTFFLIKEALDLLKAGAEFHGGKTNSSVLIVSSIAGYNIPPMIGVYGVTKTALLGMVKLMANELINENVRVNGIAPGFIKTDFVKAIEKQLEDSNQPMGQPEDIAAGAAFICADQAKFMIGETLIMSGGLQSRL